MKSKLFGAAFAAGLFAFAQTSQAATWQIVGGAPLGAAFAGYGTAPNNNNVINNPPSLVVDNTGGATWIANAQLNPVAQSVYVINWFYIGSESDRVDTFQSPLGVAVPFAETNANN